MILEGDDNCYMEWFPTTLAGGRKAYMGYPGNTGYWSKTFTLNNQYTNGDIRFQTNGTGRCMFDRVGPLRMYGNGALNLLYGVDHCYTAFYPQGTTNGRKAWSGFGELNSDRYTLCNETSNGDIRLKCNGAVHVVNDLHVDGQLSVPNRPNAKSVYAKQKDAICSLLMRYGTNYFVGTGFFISADGVIATAGHNLINTHRGDRMDAIYCSVTNVNGQVGVNRVFQCTHVGVDGAGDVGVLRVSSGLSSQTYFQWGDANVLQHGESVYVMGDPLGVDVASIAKGVIRDPKYVDINGQAVLENIFVDCIAYGGNSGSPIVNENGDAIGIYTFGFQGTEGLGGGPSQRIAQPVIDAIVQQNDDYTQKGYMGIKWKAVTQRDVVTNGLPLSYDLRGIMLTEVVSGAAAENANLMVGDILTHIDGVELGNLGENQRSPSNVTWFKTANDTVTLQYIRPPSTTVNTVVLTLHTFPQTVDQPLLGNMRQPQKMHQRI